MRHGSMLESYRVSRLAIVVLSAWRFSSGLVSSFRLGSLISWRSWQALYSRSVVIALRLKGFARNKSDVDYSSMMYDIS